MANILMLSHNDIPDARVEKESQALLAAGHKVYLIVPNVREEEAKKSFTEVITHNYNLKHYFFGFPIKKTLQHHLALIKKYNIDIIRAHNIICINIALKLAKKTDTKLIFDDHETWSLWMK
ncbi:MAG: glycosyltransferase, partial [Candidatus Thorarchaeota archaeon]